MSQNTPIARRAATAAAAGAVVDWYDFFLYGSASALIFGKLFFPNVSPAAGTLAAFATFGVGFVMRPLGGIIFGHLGDRLGRRNVLVATIVIMGVASVLVGLLPTYAQIGLWAPALLVTLRAVQGIAVGGEWGGAALIAVEHAPQDRRGLYGSWVQVGAFLGSLLSTGALFGVNALTTTAQFEAWGWRIPFVASAVLVVVGLYMRRRVEETPVFLKAIEGQHRPAVPLFMAVRSNPWAFVQIIVMRFAELIPFYLVTVFTLAYAVDHVGMSRSEVLGASLAATAVAVVTIPLYAAWSDRVGRRRVFTIGALAGAVLAVPFFFVVESGSAPLVILAAVVVVNLVNAPVVSVQQPLFSEMFGPEFRYSGAGVGYQLAGAVGGGLTPLVAAALTNRAGSSWPVALLMVVACLLATVAGLTATRGPKAAPRQEAVHA